MRLFVALDLQEDVLRNIYNFMQRMQPLAPDVRWVEPETLHITLKFIGEQPESRLSEIEDALSKISGVPFGVILRGCGFFPTPKSARVFWVGIQAGPELARLSSLIEDAFAPLGIAKEDRAFSPHLTLARSRGASGAPARQRTDAPNVSFSALQEMLAAMAVPEFGTMTAREFVLYRSQLSSHGSRYLKLAHFALLSKVL